MILEISHFKEEFGKLPSVVQECGIENVVVHLVEDAGHHVYADQPEEFNHIIKHVINQ